MVDNYENLSTTLLHPSISQDTIFGKRAVDSFIQAMNRDNDRPKRVQLLTEAIGYAHVFREAYFWRGILNFIDVGSNLRDLRTARSLTPRNTCKELVILSQIEALQRNPDKSVTILTEALSLANNKGERGEVYYFRAFANWWVDRDQEAVEDCLKAIEMKYNLKSCYTHLADMFRYMSKSKEEIEECYRKSLLPTPCYTELVKYGVYLKKSKRREEALSIFDQAIKRNPYSADAYDERSYISAQQHKDCLTALEIDKECRLVQCRRLYAAILADADKRAEAIKVLTKGIKVKGRAEWFCLLGQMRIEFANKTKDEDHMQELGRADLEKAVQLNPSDPDAQYWLGKSLACSHYESENYYQQRFRNVLHLSPNYPRFEKSDANFILSSMDLEEFKFFDGEAKGLYHYLKKGTIYQYVGITRRAIELLCSFATNNETVMFKLFKRYWEQLYTWQSNSTYATTSKTALANLWDQKLPVYPLQILKNVSMQKSNWQDLTININGMPHMAHKVLVFPEWESLWPNTEETESVKTINIEDNSDVLNVYMHFIYRKPIIVSLHTLEKTLEFAKNMKNNDIETLLTRHQTILLQNRNKTKNHQKVTEDDIYNDLCLDFRKIPKNLTKFVNNRLFSDVLFMIDYQQEMSNESCSNEKDLKYIYGHKVILEATCPYLAIMFNSGLQESSQNVIRITNVSYANFLQIMYHCYGGQVFITPDNCIELLQVTDLFGLDKLKIVCELYIGKLVDMDNYATILQIANVYNAPRLKKKCEQMKDKWVERVNSEEEDQEKLG